jgi:LysM repeat protein
MRGCRLALVVLLLAPLQAGRAQAVPPPGAAVGSAQLDVQHWIEHRVIMGERLAEIARRYRVEIADVLEWNELDAGSPKLKAGMRLRILTAESAAERKRKSYVVREGDTWQKIANRFGVSLSRLRNQWNPGIEEPMPGDKIVMFVEVEPSPSSATEAVAAAPSALPQTKPTTQIQPTTQLQPTTQANPVTQAKPTKPADALAAIVELRPSARARTQPQPQPQPQKTLAAVMRPAALPTSTSASTSAKLTPPVAPSAKPKPVPSVVRPATPSPSPQPRLPLVAVAPGGQSCGLPARGRLLNGVQVPVNDALYKIRNPDNSWGSSHAVEQLQRSIARFRQDSGFDRELLICDMSKQRGGRFRPHASHRSGRDVDIQLPVKRGYPPGHIPLTIPAVDWDATWQLVRALVASGEVQYIFLSRSRQRPLYEAALRAGERKEALEGFIQFPTNEKTALLRHSKGHVKHLHVRFKCAAHEAKCVEH